MGAVASVQSCDEIVVLDSGSDDTTCDIARSGGASVVQFKWDGRYPKKKEWALQNLDLRNDWVLYLDADEFLTPELTTEIRTVLRSENNQLAAFDLELEYTFLGTKLKYGHRVTKRALVRQSRTTWPRVDDLEVTSMWEVEGHYQPKVSGHTVRIKSPLVHDDPDPLYYYFSRHNRYSDWEAYVRTSNTLSEAVAKSRSARGKRYAALPFKPVLFFLYSYVLRLGVLDGRAGFHYAIAQAFYYWQISLKSREIREGKCSSPSRGNAPDQQPEPAVDESIKTRPHTSSIRL
ncbi:MAG: glycosyltransferase family 2 protein [Kineosporiaceae bacterium]|nr:glycosyltransferase family 2 protein [Kineosporiaceae bacterium]